jgi:serine/threonine-protein kinase HipA
MALGGPRPKLAVVVDDIGRISVSRSGAPSTHILKPDSPLLFGGVQNEALCLTLARRCGLATPLATTGKVGSRSYLLVQRYDRAVDGGRWHRTHQESFAQALGGPADANASLADVLALARRVMPAPGVLGLIDQFIFHVLVCNPDVRGSSFALMLAPSGATLAPLHGLTSMAAWDGASRKLERMLAGEHMDWRHWEDIAEGCGLNAARLLARAESLAHTALAETREAAATVAQMGGGPHSLLPRLAQAIEARARRHLAIAEGYRRSARRKTQRGSKGQPPRLAVVIANGGASA